VQREICARIAQTLATAPVHDGIGYEALSFLKLPGHSYYGALAMLHHALKPKLYVEIGTRSGDSLRLAGPDTVCVAIDPAPQFPKTIAPKGTPIHRWESKNVTVAVCTSNAFFDHPDNCDKARGFDLAFIDGDHTFAQSLSDFENLEKLAKPSSIIAIHDVIPMDERTSQPTHGGASFWTGDVWRLMSAIVATRPDLIAFTLACPPTGLGIVGRFNGGFSGISQEAVGATNMLALNPDWEWQCQKLRIVPNDGLSIAAALIGKAQ
jgi:hypothetical protein